MGVEGRTHRPVVDHGICGACAVCFHGCPAERVVEVRDGPDSLRGRVYRGAGSFALPVPGSPAQDPPCRAACPLGQDVPGYLRLLAEGRIQEALDRILEDNPLPAVCGHVCTRPCEAACTRSRIHDAVPIRTLKAFAALGGRRTPIAAVGGGPLVAVVGSGPAGLTAAHDLARSGFRSMLIESHNRPGGMLAWAVPPFRLPREALETDIQAILEMGVELRAGLRFGKDVGLGDLREEGIRALLLAAGATRSLALEIPGEDSQGVVDSLAFLRRVHAGDDRPLGGRVLVVGGGSAAMDAARTARRLGSEVLVVYRRERRDMPADPQEVEEAAAEGVAFCFLTAPVRVIVDRDGRMQGLECVRTRLGEAESGARPRPVPVPGTGHEIAGDALITALGQAPDLPRILEALGKEHAARFRLDPESGETGLAGIFAAGDFLNGPGSVVEAMACGRRAARAVHEFLRRGGSL
ncbi:MAG: FAD-dependent oxidoreductase [Deltaproteobacteria bacterium]|nr:FAD-dependent oxidoreductase [Deltaproteobacteria bacterium]